MARLRSTRSVLLAVFGALVCSSGYVSGTQQAAGAAQPAQSEDKYRQLGPAPLSYIPEGLDNILDHAEAVVVAEIGDLGAVRVDEIPDPEGRQGRENFRGYATYNVTVREVLLNKLAGVAPPLVPGVETSVQAVVGKAEALAFDARRVDVSPKDECVLFLTYIPGQPMWSLGPWKLQVRRSRTDKAAAELVRPGLEGRVLGNTMPLRTVNGGRVVADWELLKRRIKEIATAKAEK